MDNPNKESVKAINENVIAKKVNEVIEFADVIGKKLVELETSIKPLQEAHEEASKKAEVKVDEKETEKVKQTDSILQELKEKIIKLEAAQAENAKEVKKEEPKVEEKKIEEKKEEKKE